MEKRRKSRINTPPTRGPFLVRRVGSIAWRYSTDFLRQCPRVWSPSYAPTKRINASHRCCRVSQPPPECHCCQHRSYHEIMEAARNEYLIHGFIEPRCGLPVIRTARSLAGDVHLDSRPCDGHVGRDQAHVGQPARHNHRRHLCLQTGENIDGEIKAMRSGNNNRNFPNKSWPEEPCPFSLAVLQ